MAGDAPAYNTIAIRDLLLAAFTADDLRRFCQDRPEFRPILRDVAPNASPNQLTDQMLVHCETYLLVDLLLVEIKRLNPGQYARFESRLSISAEAPPEISSPYRGLKFFDVQHATDYFGREKMVDNLLKKLDKTNFVAVVGPSGCGKSSLVHAGLVPALRKGVLPDSERWQIEIFRPGVDPLRALSLKLVQLLMPDASPVDQAAEVRADGSFKMHSLWCVPECLPHLQNCRWIHVRCDIQWTNRFDHYTFL